MGGPGWGWRMCISIHVIGHWWGLQWDPFSKESQLLNTELGWTESAREEALATGHGSMTRNVACTSPVPGKMRTAWALPEPGCSEAYFLQLCCGRGSGLAHGLLGWGSKETMLRCRQGGGWSSELILRLPGTAERHGYT